MFSWLLKRNFKCTFLRVLLIVCISYLLIFTLLYPLNIVNDTNLFDIGSVICIYGIIEAIFFMIYGGVHLNLNLRFLYVFLLLIKIISIMAVAPVILNIILIIRHISF